MKGNVRSRSDKRMRALNKQLKSINALMETEEAGGELDEQQVMKIGKRDSVLLELDAMLKKGAK